MQKDRLSKAISCFLRPNILMKPTLWGYLMDSLYAIDEESIDEPEKEDYISLCGWNIAALAKCYLIGCTPKHFADEVAFYDHNKEAYSNEYNIDVEHHNSLVAERNAIVTIAKTRYLDEKEVKLLSSEHSRIETIDASIKVLRSRLSSWPFGYFDRSHAPFGLLLFCLYNSSWHLHKFYKQSIALGLYGFLNTHRDSDHTKETFEAITGYINDTAGAGSVMNAFELRVFPGMHIKLYASLLTSLLHVIDPALTFTNILKLMITAKKEIPGIMELMERFPLCLFYDKQKIVNGFYEYRPFEYTFWTKYSGKKDVGPVHERVVEYRNINRPNRSGINILLFTRPYAAIPTFFHENEHYKGDKNEASVHLKTYCFSKGFYKKYSPELLVYDGVYLSMHQLLGRSPSVDTVYAFNDLIERYYGTEMSEADAADAASKSIDGINNEIYWANNGLKWCPDQRWPKFDAHKNLYGALDLSRILNEYFMQRKTVSTVEFTRLLDIRLREKKSAVMTLENKAEAEVARAFLSEKGILGRYRFRSGKGEPLEWIKISETEHTALYISKKIVTQRRFHHEPSEVAWNGCELNEWLNTYFLNTYFTKAERAIISSVPVTLLDASRLSLLSTDRETEDIEEPLFIKPHSIGYGMSTSERTPKSNAWWLIDDSETNKNYAQTVYYHGALHRSGYSKHKAKCGVRPVVVVTK